MERLTQKQLLDEINKPEILGTRKKKVNSYALSHWQKAGAIPYPKRHSRGIGQGVYFDYPVSVIEQIKELISCLEKERSLDKAIFWLWLKDYDVNYKLILERFRNALKVYTKWWNSLRYIEILDGVEIVRPSEKLMTIISNRYQEENKRHGSRTITQVTRKSEKIVFDVYKTIILHLIIGLDFSQYNEDEWAYFLSDVLGLDEDEIEFWGRFYFDILGSIEHYLNTRVQDIKTLFDSISMLCSPWYLEDLIENGTEGEVQTAYAFFGSAIDFLLEFPELRKELKDIPIVLKVPLSKILLDTLLHSKGVFNLYYL